MFRDGVLKSIWQSEMGFSNWVNSLEDVYDVIIVGAGITGWSTALNLRIQGLKCMVLEAENSGFGTTGGTTAHLNTFFDATYDEVIRDFGLENAKLLADVGKEAIQVIENRVNQYQISCEFQYKLGYLFATDEAQKKKLSEIQEAAQKVGIEMNYTQEIPFPHSFLSAVQIENQGQFHPVKYINGLRDAYLNLGGHFIEKCRVETWQKKEEEIEVYFQGGNFRCKHLVFATHTPPGINILHLRNIPWRSYVMAVTLKSGNYPNALGYDLEDPYHYYRTQEVEGERFLILGGKDHKTGDSTDPREQFSLLEAHARKYFEVDKVIYQWSSQFYEPVDGLPYIGKLPGSSDDVYVATGYYGNGMIFGTIAGEILSELIIKGENKYEELFKPSRVKPIAGFAKFTEHNLNAAVHWVKDKLVKEKIPNLDSLGVEQGKVVSFNGNSYALFRDAKGEIHALKNECPHAKCSVEWNPAELSWDCPCHGSRFGIKGNVLNAPAVKSLEVVEIVEEEKKSNQD